jgi:hypothetical protein
LNLKWKRFFGIAVTPKLKTERIIWYFLIPLSLALLGGCERNLVLAPKGMVPNRHALPYDPFGSYITIQTSDSIRYSGELIGMRNDSVILLGESVSRINSKSIFKARVIVHGPNQYGAGFLFMVPSLFLFGLDGGEYGDGPAVMALLFTIYDAVGLSLAVGTETKKVNYYDWSESPDGVMKYSRFPYGVPQSIKLSELQRRPSSIATKK